MKLVIATNNTGKLKELSNLLAGLPIDCINLKQAGLDIEVEETGSTYRENALLKATEVHRACGLPALGDDSGLEVDALQGRPGLYSARYAPTQAERWGKLLDELKDVPEEKRTARFRCVIALVTKGFPPTTVEGVCEGRIGFAPRGSGGFGYDPLFFIPAQNCTMAELSEAVKNQISHRARAMFQAKEVLREILKINE